MSASQPTAIDPFRAMKANLTSRGGAEPFSKLIDGETARAGFRPHYRQAQLQ